MPRKNTSPLSYNDVMEVFERALETEKGLRITFKNRAAAVAFRARCNYWRKQARAANKLTYPEDHPMHGHSVYDPFVLRLPRLGDPNENTVFIQRRTIDDLDVEEID